TVGWFAREPDLLLRVGSVLLHDTRLDRPWASLKPLRLLRADDAFAIADAPVIAALAPLVEKLGRLIGTVQTVRAFPFEAEACLDAARTLVAREAWRTHGAWIETVQPRLSPEVEARLNAAREVSDAAVERAQTLRIAITGHLTRLLQG